MKTKISYPPRPWPLRRRRNTAGVTALELITALVISMVVAVIGFSGFRLFQSDLPVKSISTRFSHALSTARAFAIARNGFFQITLDLDNDRFWADEIEDPDTGAATAPQNILTPKIVPPERIPDRVRVLGVAQSGESGEVQATTGLQFFIFHPDGSADRDARIFFIGVGEDQTVDANVFTVRLYGPTGHNRVFPRQRI